MTGIDIDTALAYDFTSHLKSWWDNFQTMQRKLDVLNHSYKIKREEDRDEVIIEDGHDILIATISNHFIDSPIEYHCESRLVL